MLKTFYERHRFLIIVAAIFVLLRLPSLFEPYWYGDEGIYLVLGQAIRKGLTLYTQIHDNKPPTLYYLAAISQTVFGFRLLLAISMAASIYFFNLLSKKLLSPALSWVATIFFTIITSIPLIEGNIANAEVFMLLPTIAGIYIFFYSKSKLKLIISGLLLGLAFTLKIPVAVEFGFLFLWYFFFTKKPFLNRLLNLVIFTVSFLSPFIVYLIYFSLKGAFSDFIFAAILQNFGYLSSWQTGSHSGGATNSGLLIRVVILFTFWLFTYLLTVKKYISSNLSVIAFWFSATVFGALLSTRPYPHYLIQVAPPFTLLVILFFYSKLSRARYLVGGLVIFLAFIIFKYQFYAYPVLSYYQNFYGHVFSLSSKSYRNYFGSQVDDSYQISNYVTSLTGQDDKIFIWGDEPYIYALSNRLPVGKFTVAYHVVDFNQYQNVYDQLVINFPKVIVYFPQNGRPYPQLDHLISSYYSPSKSIGRAVIYLRR